MRPILLKGGTLVDPSQRLNKIGDVLIVDGVISAVGGKIDGPKDAEVIDCAGLIVSPGFIDVHCPLREPARRAVEAHVVAVREGGEGVGIGGGAADAELFHLLDQAGLGIARGRLGEVLLDIDGLQRRFVTDGDRRQFAGFLVFIGWLVGFRLDAMVGGLDSLKKLGPPQPGGADSFLSIRSVKLVIDGALGSRGAKLLEPYVDDPGNTGLWVSDPAVVREGALYGIEHGFQVNVHAIGDAVCDR